jgi:predicted ArsR family transcriptional regulator
MRALSAMFRSELEPRGGDPMTRGGDARTSRDRILELLRGGPHTAGELSEAIGISPQSVREQLRTLEGRGWIEVRGLRRDTGGKPAREYVLTAEGEETFEKPYPELLRQLVRELGHRLGDGGKRELLEAVGRRIGAETAGPGSGSGPGDPAGDGSPGPARPAGSSRSVREALDAAAEVLNSLGGAARVEETGEGPRIRSDGCPLSGLVIEDPDACVLARGLVEAVSGIPVRDACHRSGRPRCRFEVQPDADGQAPGS